MTNSLSRRDFLRQSMLGAAGLAAVPFLGAVSAPNQRHPLGPFPRERLPVPILPAHPEWEKLYWRAWELAWERITASPGAPQTPYLDEAANLRRIWIWDTCFMALFCRYAPDVFPGIESLNNFYAPIHDQFDSPLTIRHWDNPPLFAWVEYEHFQHTGDRDRVRWLLEDKAYLQKHYEFFDHAADRSPPESDNVALREPLGFLWSGNPSGMDNTPRGHDNYRSIYWIDALAQQALSALCIAKLARAIKREDIATEYDQRHAGLKTLLNQHYWDSKDRFYYDIQREKPHDFCRVRTPASYWPMLAKTCDEAQSEALHQHAMDPAWFGGDRPWPTVTPDSPYFSPKGFYWRGGIWLPTAYMGIKALEAYGHTDSARELATRVVGQMERTFRHYEPHTIWECYSPTADLPSTKKDNERIVRPDFCGWSALGPISLLIENIIGIQRIDAVAREVHWQTNRHDHHGVRGLRVGEIRTDLESREGKLQIQSNAPYTLFYNGQKVAVHEGQQSIEIAS